MKKIITTVLLMGVFSLVMAFSSLNSIKQIETPITLDIKPAEIEIIEVKLEPIEIEYKGHNEFLQAIGHRESGNRYEVINS